LVSLLSLLSLLLYLLLHLAPPLQHQKCAPPIGPDRSRHPN